MLKQNSELRAQAREALRGKWPMAAVAALIYSAIAGGLSSIPFIGWIGSLLVGLPVAYGFAILMLAVFRGAEEVDLGVLFAGFQEYSRILTTKLLQAVYTFLWSLLLLIPGIIKHYSYAMTDYILKDRDDVLNVFIHGNMPEKTQRIIRLYNVDEKKAVKMMADTDKRRMTNYNFYTEHKWGKASNYTLCLNSSQLGYDRCEKIIMECIK